MPADAELTLKQLRCLLALEQFRHFRRAAEHLGVTQPSLTAQIQNLESTLSLQLVERARSGAALTPVGREVARRARRIVDDEQELLNFALGARNGLSGTIGLGTSPTIGPYLLPHIVAALHRKHESLKLYVREETPRELEYELSRGIHDMLLTPLAPASADFTSEVLFREPLYLALARDHPLSRRETIAVEAIKGMTILTLSPKYQLHDQVMSICEQFGAKPSSEYEGTSIDAVRHMVGMGMGATFLPALYVHSEINARSEIACLRVTGRNILRSISLVRRKSGARSSAFVEIAATTREIARKRFPDLIVG
jgi:LysR family hydrogen peroxide-inducible transcriptional activator